MFRTFHGGIRFDLTGNAAKTASIRRFDESARLTVSMDQGGGKNTPTVAVGDRVLRYQRLGTPLTPDGLPIYSPVSGTVEAIEEAPHPFLGTCLAVILSDDKKNEERPLTPLDPDKLTPEKIIGLAHVCAIPGPIQYSDPEYKRMERMAEQKIRTLVCGAVECEPYTGERTRICAEYAHEVLDGLLLMMRAVGAEEGIVALPSHSPESAEAIRRELSSRRKKGEKLPIRLATVAAKYPAAAKLKTLFETRSWNGSTVPAGVTSPFACLSLARALTGRPVTDVILTVSGSGVSRPNVYETPIGTPMEDLFRRCVAEDGFKSIVMGGVMNGLALDGWQYPVLARHNALLLLNETTEFSRSGECIHCNQCGKVCPEGLSPVQICEYLLQNDVKEAENLGLRDCRLCGCCTYICPGRMELTEILKNGKGALTP